MIATLKMNDGYSIPQLGMGAYLLPDGDECYNSIRGGLDLGLRLIDTAVSCDENERTVVERRSGLRRSARRSLPDDQALGTGLWV